MRSEATVAKIATVKKLKAGWQIKKLSIKNIFLFAVSQQAIVGSKNKKNRAFLSFVNFLQDYDIFLNW